MGEDEIALSDNMLNCVLIQTKLGEENRVKTELEKAFLGKALVFIGLGRYDLVVLSEQHDFSTLEKFRQGEFPGIVDSYTVCGGQWTPKGVSLTYPVQDSTKEIAICVIKPIVLQGEIDQIDIERKIAAKILKGKFCRVYSNLSNHELVCVFSGDDLAHLNRTIEVIKESCIAEDKKIQIIDMMTIPAVNYEKIAGNSEKIRAFIFLSLRLGINASLKSEIERIIQIHGCKLMRSTPAYGFHDVIIDIEGPMEAMINVILDVRKQGVGKGLLSTYTIVTQNEQIFDYQIPSDQYPLRTDPRFTGSKILEDCPTKEEMLFHFSNLFETTMEDCFTQALFRNHTNLLLEMRRLLEDALQFRTDGDFENFQLWSKKFDNMADCLRLTFSQRYSSLLPGNLLGSKSLGLEPHGGIQRAILASESIPLFVFNELKEKWNGFCVFGYFHKFFRLSGGIFNVPEALRVKPETWGGGLLHEIGHEIFLNLPETLHSNVRKFLADLNRENVEASRERNQFLHVKKLEIENENFASEIFADLFSFAVGYQCDWDRFSSDRAESFSREGSVNYEQITRYVVAYLSMGPGKDVTRTVQMDHASMMNWIDDFDTLAKEFSGFGLSDGEKQRSESMIYVFAELGRLLASYFEENLFWKVEKSNDDLDRIVKSFKDGTIYKTDNPIEIIHALIRQKNKLTLKEGLAAMLSLYNTYWRIYSRMQGRTEN